MHFGGLGYMNGTYIATPKQRECHLPRRTALVSCSFTLESRHE
jgi:hypothetical protein